MKDEKPKLYLTRDDDGLHLWFCVNPPQIGRKRGSRMGTFNHSMAAAKVRLPLSWYGGIIQDGACREYDPGEIFL